MIAWTPTDTDLEWTRAQLDALGMGEVWDAGEMKYQRTGEAQLTLLTRTERATEAHGRVLIALESLEWECVDGDAIITPDDPVEQLQQAQEFAREWRCPNEECETLLVDCDLDAAAWVNMGMQPAIALDGSEMEAERWLVDVPCISCATPVPMNPLEYALIAGDDLFHTFSTPEVTYRVLSREQTIALIDEGGEGFALGSRGINNEAIPPHMQGAFCTVEIESDTSLLEEE